LFKEIIAVYSENCTKPINTKYSVAVLRQLGHIITTRLQRVKDRCLETRK
jgi:hypothetical protein